MDKTTLMIRAACGVVLLVPIAFGVLWVRQQMAVKACVLTALSEQLHGSDDQRRKAAEAIYNDGKDLDAETRMMLSICRIEHRLFG